MLILISISYLYNTWSKAWVIINLIIILLCVKEIAALKLLKLMVPGIGTMFDILV